jgi:hypothetical protein
LRAEIQNKDTIFSNLSIGRHSASKSNELSAIF